MSTNKGFPRRLLLGGAACAVALPFFESLTPKEARPSCNGAEAIPGVPGAKRLRYG